MTAEDKAFEHRSVAWNLRQSAEQLANRREGDRLCRLESHEAHAAGSVSPREDLDQKSRLAIAGLSSDEDDPGRPIGACAFTDGIYCPEFVLAAHKRRAHMISLVDLVSESRSPTLRGGQSGEAGSLEGQQEALAVQAAGVAAQPTVGVQDPMARHHDRDRVGAECVARGAVGTW